MPSTLVLAAVLLVAGQTASASSVDLAEIQGTVVPGGKEVRGVVEPGGSAWFALDARARMGYVIETEIGGSYGPIPGADEPQDALDDTYLRLYDTDGETVLDANDDELVGKESLIHWMCPKTGRYFLEVTAHSAGEAGWFHIYSEEMAHWHHEV